MSYLWVAIGAGFGGVLRYWCSGVAVRLGAETFPWGTLFINVAGSAFIGWFAAMSGPDGRWLIPANTRLLVMTGLCGGFTTFSTFSLETLRLIEDRQWGPAAWNVSLSVGLCLAGVWLGNRLANGWDQR